MPYLIVFTTAATKKEAEKIASYLLSKRLAACVNITAPVRSYYWWKGKKEKAKEFLLVIKTRQAAFAKLEKAIRRIHSYSVPEVLAVSVRKGSRPYLAWLGREIKTR